MIRIFVFTLALLGMSQANAGRCHINLSGNAKPYHYNLSSGEYSYKGGWETADNFVVSAPNKRYCRNLANYDRYRVCKTVGQNGWVTGGFLNITNFYVEASAVYSYNGEPLERINRLRCKTF